jgi:5-deoxy-glucuronate isomerase
MLMSTLLIKPAPGAADGLVHHITPASAGWSYVGFETFDLAPGQALAQATEGREACLVLLSGRAEVNAGGQDLGTIGERTNPFEGVP